LVGAGAAFFAAFFAATFFTAFFAGAAAFFAGAAAFFAGAAAFTGAAAFFAGAAAFFAGAAAFFAGAAAFLAGAAFFAVFFATVFFVAIGDSPVAASCGGFICGNRIAGFCFLWERVFLHHETALASRHGDDPIQTTRFHLTARPWKPLNVLRDQCLQAIEGVCRFSIRHQNAEGAIIDPFHHREHLIRNCLLSIREATRGVLHRADAIGREATSRRQWDTWRDRMRTPRKDVISETTNNRETYVMKGGGCE